ncbi:SDR family NAD(P)-dependent oxidoreductase [Nocardioides sp.]|uniref:SDR family NAD(P)-dependent oxidoreductase n=1 Tax=Nocardioides sp. TaxID=35761 RepID=UPI00273775F2|nr:SDR family NAD(P)-dependent oxidoreductase [Nocardioides sp.]MDP3890135.1 SDR family NAD(P)-dependent oxidoreductase [Nocardioides sp.]
MAGLFIVGTGPGIATSVARRFGATGMPVGLLSRTTASLDAAQRALRAAGVERVATSAADAGSELGLRSGLDRLLDSLGVPEVVVYNAGLIRFDRPGELDHAGHQAAYAVNVLGALTTAAHLAPRMAAAGGGTIIVTGGMPQPLPTVVSLSLGKAGVRALTTMLAAEYGPAGVHVATVTVCDAVVPGTDYDPDAIAEHYWRLHRQAPDQWEHEVTFRGASTFAGQA